MSASQSSDERLVIRILLRPPRKWLSGSWNRLLGRLSPQTAVNMSAVERENRYWNAGAAINFKRENNNLPAISPDGTLNWPWVSQGHIRQTNR